MSSSRSSSTSAISETSVYDMDSMTVSMAFLVVCANNQLRKSAAQLNEKIDKAHKKYEKYQEILRGVEQNMARIMKIVELEKSVNAVHGHAMELKDFSEDLLRNFQDFMNNTKNLGNVTQNIDWTGDVEDLGIPAGDAVEPIPESGEVEFGRAANSFTHSIDSVIKTLEKINQVEM